MTVSTESLLQFIRRVAAPGDDSTDEQLLDRFTTLRDEAAFAALVRRHGPMVLGVCRRVLADAHDAEDAFQAAFLVLARKAASAGRPRLLAHWLYGVAYRTALKARTERATRRVKERQAEPRRYEAPADPAWTDLRPVLDEEIGRLPAKYRVPFVLCYLEGKTNEEAARLIGCPKGTVLSRLAWARERLRERLIRRDVGLSAGLLATLLLSENAASAGVPAPLVNSAAKAAAAFAAGQADAGRVAPLAEGVLRAMLMSRVRAAAFAAAVALAAAFAGVLAHPALAEKRPDVQPQGPAAGGEQTPPTPELKGAEPLTLAGVCRDEKSRPVSGARVVLCRETDFRRAERLRVALTGDAGEFRFRNLAPPPDRDDGTGWMYTLVVTKQGRGSVVMPVVGQALKAPLRLELRPAATLRGRVTDANGKPIAGAQVWAALGLMTALQEGVCSTRTDADGRYAITDMGTSLPDDFKPRPLGKNLFAVGALFPFDVLHPDYGHERPQFSRIPATVDIVLRPAGIIEGRVVDQVTGKPAAGVVVCLSTMSASGRNFGEGARTNASGKYRFSSLAPDRYNLWAGAPDRTCAALDSFPVEAGKTYTAPDLFLIEGGWIEGQVVDAETGKPIGGRVKGWPLRVGLYGPARPRSGSGCQASLVDDHGRFRLRVAPGINYPYIMRGDYWERTEGRQSFEKGVEVKAGQVLRVTFRVHPAQHEP